MMNRYLLQFILIWGIVGCNSGSGFPATPSNFENFPSAATQIAQTSTTQANGIETTFPFTPIPDALDVKTELIFRDDFAGNLDPTWRLINERKELWSMESRPGYLQINAIGGYFKLNNASNVLLQSAPQDDFTIETSLIFDPEASDQFAGLIVIGSNSDFVQAGIGYCPHSVGCIGRGFYVDVYTNGKLSIPRNSFSIFDDYIFIRIMVSDGLLHILTSLDRSTWYRIYEQKLPFEVQQVGIIAAQNNDSLPEVAVFDYFEINSIDK